MEDNILDATAPVIRELTVDELDNVHGGFASAEHAFGGATSGSGAGKASFNELSVKKTVDISSPV